MIAESHPRLQFVADYLTPTDGSTVYRDRWWVKHPEKGLVIWNGSSPQCSYSRAIADKLTPSLYPWAVIEFIPLAYIPKGAIDDD